jgi:glycosyltransferase involved in cell wall biosynthesis
LVKALGLNARIEFAGLVPNDEVRDRMRESDVVIVPSRHEYPEGLPLTIYEALCARTPIIASDHPMFAGALVHEQSALIFRAGDPAALARSVARLIEEPNIYEALSMQSAATWDRLQLPVKWDEMVEHWLADDVAWLARYSLSSGMYQMHSGAEA